MKKLFVMISLLTIPGILLGAAGSRCATTNEGLQTFARARKWDNVFSSLGQATLRNDRIDINTSSAAGKTLLTIAVEQGNKDAVKRLLDWSADVQRGNPKPISIAIDKLVDDARSHEDLKNAASAKIIKSLFKHGATLPHDDSRSVELIADEQQRSKIINILEPLLYP